MVSVLCCSSINRFFSVLWSGILSLEPSLEYNILSRCRDRWLLVAVQWCLYVLVRTLYSGKSVDVFGTSSFFLHLWNVVHISFPFLDGSFCS